MSGKDRKTLIGSAETPSDVQGNPTTTPPQASQPQGEEHNETPTAQTAPTTTTTPESASQTTQPPTIASVGTMPTTSTIPTAPTPNTTTAPTTAPPTEVQPTSVDARNQAESEIPSVTESADNGKFKVQIGGKTIEVGSMGELVNALHPQTSDEDKKKEMKREKRNALISAIGDGLASLSNLYFTAKGAPDQGLKPGMTDAAKKRMDELRERWQKEKDKYEELMLKAAETDRQQGNWLKSYQLSVNADKRGDAELKLKQDEFEEGKKKREKEMAVLDEEIKKLKDDNELNEATKEKRLEIKEKELDAKEREYDDYIKYGMSTYQKKSLDESTRHDKASESIDNRRLDIEERKSDGSYTVYKGDDEKALSKSEIDRVYMQMVRDGVASGRATTTQARLNVIQNYYGQGVRFSSEDPDEDISNRSFSKKKKDYIKRWKKGAAGGGAYDNF